MKFNSNKSDSSFKRAYNFYAKGLSYKDVEKLLKKDVKEVYDFYSKRMQPPSPTKNKFTHTIILIKNLFIEFLERLTPIRRILYSAALILFIFSYMGNNWEWAIFSVFLFNVLIAFELADKLTAKSEIDVAREIQIAMMPNSAPSTNYFDIACFGDTAQEVGGDYYEFIPHPNDNKKIYLIIGDISGKGMAAALYMVQVRAILHYLMSTKASPKAILIELNNHLVKVLKRGTFFTASMARLNNDGTLTFSRAGHMPLIHYKKNEQKCYSIIPKGIGMGLTLNHIFDTTLEEVTLKFAPGDILAFYTDGIVEARNSYNQEFGKKNLTDILEKNSNKSVEEINKALLLRLSLFSDSAPVHDDYSFILLKAKLPKQEFQHL